jgi:uncharacterized protein (DUF305 family)
MKVLYQNWFGKTVPQDDGMMMGMGGVMHMGNQQDLDTLKNSPDFDKAFIEQMIPHHQMAIMMVRMLKSGTNRPEMKQLAENIISSQIREIKEMQSWYNAWYK